MKPYKRTVISDYEYVADVERDAAITPLIMRLEELDHDRFAILAEVIVDVDAVSELIAIIVSHRRNNEMDRAIIWILTNETDLTEAIQLRFDHLESTADQEPLDTLERTLLADQLIHPLFPF